jgi:hypothetical protein
MNGQANLKPLLSLSAFNASTICEKTYRFPLIGFDGAETSVFLTIKGSESKSVKDAIYKKLDKKRRQEKIDAECNRKPAFVETEVIVLDQKESIAMCIVGWSGLDVEYTPELAVQLVANSDLVLEQVKNAAERVSNFI